MNNEPLLDIRPDHLKMVQEILKKHLPDQEVWAFGSRVKGTAREYSD
ncbi:MAG: nucleotidyltransferase domain-containing protein, partial [Magnetococcales bacterium]|nr:nucleotidyltransferase domain-containing protein [Magnetococcales bacterium]